MFKASNLNKVLAQAKSQLGGISVTVLKIEPREDDSLRVTLNDEIRDGSFIAEILVKNGFRLKMLREEEIDLEDVFMAITKGITN